MVRGIGGQGGVGSASCGAAAAQAHHAQVLGAAQEGGGTLSARILGQRHAGRLSHAPSLPMRARLLNPRRGPRRAGRQDVEEVVQDGGAAHRLGGQEGALTEMRHLHAVHGDLRVLLVLKETTAVRQPQGHKVKGQRSRALTCWLDGFTVAVSRL